MYQIDKPDGWIATHAKRKVVRCGTRRNAKLRAYHFKRQDGNCAYCLKPMWDAKGRDGGRLIDKCTLDHIIPLSLGGEDTKNNTCASCDACNTKKGSGVLTKADMERV